MKNKYFENAGEIQEILAKEGHLKLIKLFLKKSICFSQSNMSTYKSNFSYVIMDYHLIPNYYLQYLTKKIKVVIFRQRSHADDAKMT